MNTETTQYETPSPEEFRLTDEEIRKHVSDGLIQWEDERRKQAINQLFVKENLDYEFIRLPWYQRLFYWTKCFICLAFEWTDGTYYNDCIAMVGWNLCYYPEGQTWDCVWVETGLFKNWKVCVGSDGT